MNLGRNDNCRYRAILAWSKSIASVLRRDAKRPNGVLLYLLLISFLVMSGCPPPRASLLVQDDHGSYNPASFGSMTYGDEYYSLNDTYSIDQLNARLADNEISRIEMILSDGTKARGDSLSILDGSVLLAAENRMRGEYELSRINRFILYKTIPFSERRDRFLTPFVLFTLMSVVGAVSTDDYSDIWIGPLIGAGLGLPQFFPKYRIAERVFNSYNPEVEANAVVRPRNY
jgi:hypothetical protein